MANEVDGSINFETKIKTDGLEGQLNKVTQKINKLADNKTLTAFSRLGASITGVQSAFSMVTGAVQKANAVIKETTQLYKIQANAEKQLEIAVKNNPYMSDSATRNLKDFASELQSISTVGDESLIPMMAQLAASGRTEEQIQSIMSAALDVSASGMMSLDSAVQSLNSSYSGNIGLLGRQVSELKTLTTEELESGKAVEIIGEKFKGMAAETAKATGSSEQLKNAIGDMKEEIGASFEKKLTPVRAFFTELISGWTNAAKARREYKEAQEKDENGTATNDSRQVEIAGFEHQAQQLQHQIDSATTSGSVSQEAINKRKEELQAIKDKIQALKDEIAIEEQAKQKQAAEIKQQEEVAANTNKAASAYVKFQQTLKDAEDSIQQRKDFGENISEEDELQEMLNVKTQAYVQLLKDADGTISGTSEREKAFVQQINDDYKKLYEMQEQQKAKEEAEKQRTEKNNEVSGTADSLISSAKSYTDNTKDLLSNQIDAEILLLDEYIEELKAAGLEYQDFTDKRNELEQLHSDVVKKEAEEQKQATLESVTSMMDTINSYVTQFSEISSNLTDMIKTNSEKQTDSELNEISKQYEDGLISYEEFCEKKGEINKKAKQEEYKAELWEYYSNLASAIANTAVAVTKALSESGNPALAIINAALISASGAAQIATLTANKPSAPSFATGGVIQGGNFNDGIMAHVSSGEMVLNSAQQMNLWKMANGNSSANSGVSMPVTIINNNGSNVKQKMTVKGLKLVIDDVVTNSATDGKYADAIGIGNNINNGLRYL